MTSWMIGPTPLSALMKLDFVLAEQFFNTPASYLLGSASVPSGWWVTPVTGYRSYSDFVTVPTVTTHWVLYDPESWASTPVIEQQHPSAYMAAFAQLAHSRGQQVIVTPARSLMSVSSADCAAQVGEGLDTAYLRCRIPAAGSTADIFECQAQADQGNPSTYQALVLGAKTQQPSGQPLWAGLTTLRGDSVPAMVACYESVLPSVEGFWLNTSVDTIQVAADFLTAISSKRK